MTTKFPKYPDAFHRNELELVAKYLRPGALILDPMAGLGGVHYLRHLVDEVKTVGVEIEPEWSSHPFTICADSTRDLVKLFGVNRFDAIVSVPPIGNYTSKPSPTPRLSTYRDALGRPLHPRNAARFFFHNDQHKELLADIWRQSVEVLKPGGHVYFLGRSFFRRQRNQDGTMFHLQTLHDLGLWESWVEPVKYGFYGGLNGHHRVQNPYLCVMEKPPLPSSANHRDGPSEGNVERVVTSW